MAQGSMAAVLRGLLALELLPCWAEPCIWPSDGSVPRDDQGRYCVGCGVPLPGRGYDNRSYTVRSDCGRLVNSTGWLDGAIDIPVVQLSQPATSNRSFTNGFCELNDQKSCFDGIVNRDYLFMAKKNDVSVYPECFRRWDSEYCRVNGFLEPELAAIVNDFDALQAAASHLCETKYAALYDFSKITLRDEIDSYYESMQRGDVPTQEEAYFSAAWNCAMGDLGCEIAYCGYSFCELPNGDIGWYEECDGWNPITGMVAEVQRPAQGIDHLFVVGITIISLACVMVAVLLVARVKRQPVSESLSLGVSLQETAA